jgi:L-galactose dehydrogenase
MDYTILGRTGLSVSVMGLGCGGHSRLGMAQGKTQSEATAIVRQALDMGINFIDTAESYGTEPAVAQALEKIPRGSVVLSTKLSPRKENRQVTGAEFKERAEGTLQRLGTDYVDILHLHGVAAEDYAYCLEELVPALRDLQSDGKIRFLGITEAFGADPQHRMLRRAVDDDCWDVIMTGFNILNQSARERVLSKTRVKNIGILCMFAVRRALSSPAALRELMQKLAAEGLVKTEEFAPDDPLGFLLEGGSAMDVPDAAYRFCRYEPGIHVTLSGTGNAEHLKRNAESLNRPPLPQQHNSRLISLFQRVDSVSGNLLELIGACPSTELGRFIV